MKEKIDSDRLAKYFPLVVLAIGVAISLFSYNEIRAQRIDQNWKEYFRRTEEIVNRIQGRLNAFEGILLSAAGLLAASTEVTRDEFKTFVKTLRLDQSYPGVQGVGFSQRILPSELEFHQKKIRQSGFPQYTISPPGVRDIYTSIIFLEPFEGRNLRAFGYDMYSEPVRRQAMDRAMRTGQSAMSGKVVLVQETEKDIQPGFLIYVPVYKNLPDDPSEEDRVRCLIGWSYSPFRMRDLMAGVLGQYWTQSEMGIVFSIYDGENISAEAQLHESHFDQSDRSHERRFKSQQKITFLGRTWTFNFHADSQFFTGGDIVNREKLALVFGIFMSIGLSSIIWILMSSRDRAVKYAQEVNRNLIESEERFRNMANSAPVLIWISDPENYMTWFNKVWLDFTGRRISQELKEGWLEGVHPEDRELCRQVHRQCFSDQKPFTIEFRLKRHDGVYRWVLDAGVPRFSEKGEFYGYIGSCLDISEMKKNISDRIQAEKKLSEAFEKIKEQKRRLDLVIWGTKTATWDWNIKTGETTFNDRWAEIIGYQLSELEPVDINTWIKYTHPDDLAESGRQLERHFRGETDLYS
ncbi:MAG: hypothetical protein BroJett040_07800 [Oligoflexia bacterium]|nr:MAG: hypothetical protein BroJett040_07800 [Oligoflexia bacterium]